MEQEPNPKQSEPEVDKPKPSSPEVDRKALEKSKQEKEKAIEQNEIVKKDENQTAIRT